MTDRSIHLDIAQTPGENAARLASQPAQSLAETMVNHVLNEFIAAHNTTSFDGCFGQDTPVPYQGWYWRSVDFFGRITIADGDGQVAICESNKWGYPERSLTDAERDHFLALVWEAYIVSQQGGRLDLIRQATREALKRAGQYIAQLSGPFEGGDW